MRCASTLEGARILLLKEFFHSFLKTIEWKNAAVQPQRSATIHSKPQHRLWSYTWYPVLD